MNTNADLIHLRRRYARDITCGITGNVRVTEIFREVTCQDCTDAEMQDRKVRNGGEGIALANLGDEIADTSTGTYIKVTNMGGHFHLYVQAGADRIPELSGNYPTAQAACRRASYLRTALHAGTTVQQLVDAHTANQAGVLAVADAVLTGALDRTAEQVAEAINAAADQRQAEVEAGHNELVADRDDIMAGADPNWKANLRAEVVQAAKHANSGRPIHPTRTRVHCKPPTPAELDRIRNHHNGIVTTAPGQSWTLLRAIVRRGLGDVHEVRGRHVIASVRLNTRGLAVAAEVAA